ncbi:excalibur calcium-binding domain-containing protein [Bacillus salipaludis]|uniref:Excalibur calcium-binding domain-containing protein n=1 Tax=Bacillus salipaludis TaxID=2547811 RepID=A0A4R5VTN8_9BACI|nr:excalibur calcium-binding domain-containing protein [Bacillus salipaludis]TDK62150.1 excalibur calcium-binding domain-containing protein [Bacillus salipaludis]
MKRFFAFLLAFGLVLGFSYGSSSQNVAEAKSKIVTFKNCKAMNKVYKGGVARSSKVKNKGGKTHYKPFVSKALYDANKSRDRDKDLIACER